MRGAELTAEFAIGKGQEIIYDGSGDHFPAADNRTRKIIPIDQEDASPG
jgi:hypothetical protein